MSRNEVALGFAKALLGARPEIDPKELVARAFVLAELFLAACTAPPPDHDR